MTISNNEQIREQSNRFWSSEIIQIKISLQSSLGLHMAEGFKMQVFTLKSKGNFSLRQLKNLTDIQIRTRWSKKSVTELESIFQWRCIM
jgi:hypothetical protein